ncbi:MAG: HAD family hydrolase [Beijerinckiaceae bacterium]
MRRIKAVLFDKDGTLLDFNRTWGPATHAVLTRLADGRQDHFDALIEAVGFTPGTVELTADSPVVSDPTPIYARRWADILERAADEDFFTEIDRLFAESALQNITPVTAARQTLEKLHVRGVKLGLATNDAEANARAQLKHLGLDELLDFVSGYDSGFGVKPDPGMVLAFAEHAGVAPWEVAMVGDTLHDLHAARGAGAMAIAVLSGLAGEAAREQLSPHADLVLLSLDELPLAIS